MQKNHLKRQGTPMTFSPQKISKIYIDNFGIILYKIAGFNFCSIREVMRDAG